MKSSEPPPNIRLPAELSSNQFPPMRGNSSTDMMHTELSSPHANRVITFLLRCCVTARERLENYTKIVHS